MATRTISNGGGNWNSVGSWVEGATPTSADDVVATGTSGNLTVNVSSACRSIDLTGYVGTLTLNSTLSIGTSTPGPSNVALKFVSGMTLAGTGSILLNSTSSTQQTVDTGGKTILGLLTFNGSGGSWLLTSSIVSTGTSVSLVQGTLNTGGYDITCSNGSFLMTGNFTRTLTLNSSTLTLGRFIDTNTTNNTTVNAGTSHIIITSSGTASSSGFGFWPKTLYKMTINCDNHTLTRAFTLDQLIINNAGGTTGTKFNSGTAITILTSLTTNGSAGNLVKLISTTSGSAWTISKSSGTISVDYVSLQDSTATGGATFYAGANSTNVSGNTGWNFTAPPSGSVGMVILNRRFKSANRARRM